MKARIDYLLKQYFYDSCSREELEELFGIIRSARYDDELSELIRERYEALKREDPSASYISADGQLGRLSDAPDHAGQPIRRSSVSPWSLRSIYIAATAAAAVLLIGFFYGQRFVESEPNITVQVIKSVAPDEKKIIILSDGTKVWVNASSQLEYPQQFVVGQSREVILHGEAYFEVEHAEEWPFVVNTGDIQTKVLGLKFNVKAYPGQNNVLVSVRSGKVQVMRQQQLLGTLVQNQEISVGRDAHASIVVPPEKQLKSKVAGNWIQGYLEYEDEPIAAIVSDLERVYGISVEWRDADVANKVVTLSVPSDSEPAYILDILSTLTDMQVRHEGKHYIIF